VAGAGALWVDANAEAVAGNGALWEEDDRRSPIIALDLELVSDPIGSGEQPTDPATKTASANSLPKRESCDMASSTPVNPHSLWPSIMAQIAAIEGRPDPVLRAPPPTPGCTFCVQSSKKVAATIRPDRCRRRPPLRQPPETITG
jgi:hypothetical protein